MAGFKLKLWSGSPNVQRVAEGATQTFSEGDLVKISSGLAIIATDGNDAWGVAAKKASGTTNTMLPVYVITSEQVWTVSTSGTPARATHVGNPYDFTGFTAGNNIKLDLSDSTNDDAIVVDLHPSDTAASGSRVLVRFNYASADAIGG